MSELQSERDKKISRIPLIFAEIEEDICKLDETLNALDHTLVNPKTLSSYDEFVEKFTSKQTEVHTILKSSGDIHPLTNQYRDKISQYVKELGNKLIVYFDEPTAKYKKICDKYRELYEKITREAQVGQEAITQLRLLRLAVIVKMLFEWILQFLDDKLPVKESLRILNEDISKLKLNREYELILTKSRIEKLVKSSGTPWSIDAIFAAYEPPGDLKSNPQDQRTPTIPIPPHAASQQKSPQEKKSAPNNLPKQSDTTKNNQAKLQAIFPGMKENLKKLDLAITELDKILVDPTVDFLAVIRDFKNQQARAAAILEKYKSAEAYKKRLNHYKEEYTKKKGQYEKKLEAMCLELCRKYQKLETEYNKVQDGNNALLFLQLLLAGDLLFAWLYNLTKDQPLHEESKVIKFRMTVIASDLNMYASKDLVSRVATNVRTKMQECSQKSLDIVSTLQKACESLPILSDIKTTQISNKKLDSSYNKPEKKNTTQNLTVHDIKTSIISSTHAPQQNNKSTQDLATLHSVLVTMKEDMGKLDLAMEELDKVLADPTVDFLSVIHDLEKQYAHAITMLERNESQAIEKYKNSLNEYKEEYTRKKAQYVNKLEKICSDLCEKYGQLEEEKSTKLAKATRESKKNPKLKVNPEDFFSFWQLLAAGTALFGWLSKFTKAASLKTNDKIASVLEEITRDFKEQGDPNPSAVLRISANVLIQIQQSSRQSLGIAAILQKACEPIAALRDLKNTLSQASINKNPTSEDFQPNTPKKLQLPPQPLPKTDNHKKHLTGNTEPNNLTENIETKSKFKSPVENTTISDLDSKKLIPTKKLKKTTADVIDDLLARSRNTLQDLKNLVNEVVDQSKKHKPNKIKTEQDYIKSVKNDLTNCHKQISLLKNKDADKKPKYFGQIKNLEAELEKLELIVNKKSEVPVSASQSFIKPVTDDLSAATAITPSTKKPDKKHKPKISAKKLKQQKKQNKKERQKVKPKSSIDKEQAVENSSPEVLTDKLDEEARDLLKDHKLLNNNQKTQTEDENPTPPIQHQRSKATEINLSKASTQDSSIDKSEQPPEQKNSSIQSSSQTSPDKIPDEVLGDQDRDIESPEHEIPEESSLTSNQTSFPTASEQFDENSGNTQPLSQIVASPHIPPLTHGIDLERGESEADDAQGLQNFSDITLDEDNGSSHIEDVIPVEIPRESKQEGESFPSLESGALYPYEDDIQVATDEELYFEDVAMGLQNEELEETYSGTVPTYLTEDFAQFDAKNNHSRKLLYQTAFDTPKDEELYYPYDASEPLEHGREGTQDDSKNSFTAQPSAYQRIPTAHSFTPHFFQPSTTQPLETKKNDLKDMLVQLGIMPGLPEKQEVDLQQPPLPPRKFTKLPEEFSLKDLEGILTPEKKTALTKAVELIEELRKIGVNAYVSGSFLTECAYSLLTDGKFEAKDIDLVIELPKDMTLAELLKKVPLTTRSFPFQAGDSDGRTFQNYFSTDKKSTRVELSVRTKDYVSNDNPFPLTGGKMFLRADPEAGIKFKFDQAYIKKSESYIKNKKFPVHLSSPEGLSNIRHFFPRFAKYLPRCQRGIQMLYYYDFKKSIQQLPADKLSDYLENYFKHVLRLGGLNVKVKHHFAGMVKMIQEGNFTDPLALTIIQPFCRALLSFVPGVTQLPPEYLIRAGKAMADILQHYFKAHSKDAPGFSEITNSFRSQETILSLASISHSNQISGWAELLYKSRYSVSSLTQHWRTPTKQVPAQQGLKTTALITEEVSTLAQDQGYDRVH